MAIRPSKIWQNEVSRNTGAADLYSAAMLDATDASLASFEDQARSLSNASDEQILTAVERVVLKLNAIDYEHGSYCTIEREELCEYIDQVLTDQGIDVSGLAARNGMDDLTGTWRDW
ncbi:hypothetical protein ACWD6R_38710 [Streptomyces sp. NPDC005151]